MSYGTFGKSEAEIRARERKRQGCTCVPGYVGETDCPIHDGEPPTDPPQPAPCPECDHQYGHAESCVLYNPEVDAPQRELSRKLNAKRESMETR